MRELFFRFKTFSIITIIFSAVIGVILLMKPEEGIYAISMIVGASLILIGIAAWISYLVKDRLAFLAVMGTILFVGGIVICFAYQTIANIIVLVLGVFLIVSGIVNLFAAFDSRHFRVGSWLVSLIMALLMIILGFVVVMISPRGDAVVGTLLGAALLFYAIMDILALIEIIQKAKRVKENLKTAQKELENAMNQFDEDVQNSANEFKNEMNYAAGNATEVDVEAEEIE